MTTEKIAIAVPSNRGMKIQTYKCLMDMVTQYPKDFFNVIATQGYTISENRTYLVGKAMGEECTHILFVDDDMTFPPDTLQRLLDHDKDIIGVVYHSKMFPPKPVVVLENGIVMPDIDLDMLMTCQHVGTGIMLVKLDVFNKIKKPWFDIERHENGFTVMGEDAWFCKQARKAGYNIWCDTTIKVGHLGDFEY